jgi:ribonuclease J
MSSLRILPLGGIGKVTQNMYLYEYGDEILIVDCGIGFPDTYMPGVDVLIPDISYLLSQLEAGKRIIGMVLTHGHDDHIAALPYLAPSLPDFPVYGSPLTIGFAEQRLRDGKFDLNMNTIRDNRPVRLSNNFSFQLLEVTHSVPDTRHVVIHTPEGIIYHGSDFKLDPAPVDNKLSDLKSMAALADQNVLCMMVDCLRVENKNWVKSESTTGPAIESIMAETKGKFVATLMSSHIHRIQQTVDAAEKHGRKVVFIGRSVEQNVEIAVQLDHLHIPKGMMVHKRDMEQWDDKKLCLIVAGSQGQEGSTLTRAIFGDHPILRISGNDVVAFSADVIPGNEIAYYGAIDELSRNKIHVVYPDVMPEIHRSGHASTPEQQEIVGLVKPRFLMPIGGADRHRAKFHEEVAAPLGYREDQVLIPDSGDILSFSNGSFKVDETVSLRPQIVDGLGVGDVGPVVLSDRRALGQAGIVVVVVTRHQGRFDLGSIEVVSRGFVFMKEADEVVSFIKQTTAETIAEELGLKSAGNTGDTGERRGKGAGGGGGGGSARGSAGGSAGGSAKGKGSRGAGGRQPSDEALKRMVEKRLARRLYKAIRREPMIVPVFLDL